MDGKPGAHGSLQSSEAQQSIAQRLIRIPPIYLTTLGVIAGDGLGNLHLCVPLWAAMVATVVAAALFLLKRPLPGIAIAWFGLVFAAILPVSHLLSPDPGPQTVRRFPDGARVTLDGWIVREPEPQGGGRTYLYVDLEDCGIVGSPMLPTTGLVRITALGQLALRVGDKLRASGKLRFPRNEGDEDEFDYRAWLMRQGIAATIVAAPSRLDSTAPITVIAHRNAFPQDLLQTARERIAKLIDATLGYPENAEMRAVIIGDRGGIDERLRQPFALTGMAHLLVISGLHLGLVASAAFVAARLMEAAFPSLMVLGYGNKIAAGAAIMAATGYAAIAGGHVSTIRALVMVIAFALAILLDRARELLASLALAALLLCLAMPGSTADIGFQLSFMSVGVILLGMRRFRAWWRHYANPLSVRRERSRIRSAAELVYGYFALSFWAMLGTAPLTAFHFNQFSLVGLVANPIVVPIMGLGAVAFGLVAAGCSFIYLR
jgi:competence protein ComEC